MIIKNATVFTEQGTFEKKDIVIKEGHFSEVGCLTKEDCLIKADYDIEEACSTGGENGNKEDLSAEEEVVDAEGLIAIPGLIDLHFHGCMGVDFCDGTKEAFETITKYQAQQGITTLCPATMTIGEESLLKVCEAVKSFREEVQGQVQGAQIVGINMEGPFVSSAKKGAQNEAYIRKIDLDLYRRMQAKSGDLIKLVDLAPELEGAMEFIEAVKDEVVISVAHTNADYDTAMAAFEKGASHVTHLYNAMPPYSHRAPGVVGAASDSAHCIVELICDGIHIHPSVVRNTFRMFGKERIALISDSMMATGLSDGEYTLGGQKVYVKGKRATLADGTVAGSVSNLLDCVRTCVKEMGIPLEEAIWSATMTPAKVLGIEKQCGSITPGKIAHLVLLNKDLEVEKVFL